MGWKQFHLVEKMQHYAFGAASLREEMVRHKQEDSERWSLKKRLGIRIVYVYAVVMTVVFMLLCMIAGILRDLKR